MRFSTITALFSLAAALPTSPVEQNTALISRDDAASAAPNVAVREAEHLDARGLILLDATHPWPATTLLDGGQDAQFRATKLSGDEYKFDLWLMNPRNGGNAKFRISNAGVTLGEKVLTPQTTGSLTVKKTGSNFNVWIETL